MGNRASRAHPSDLTPLLTALGVEIDAELLTLALTHRSFAYESGGLQPNERLEFLGDAVLGVVVTDHLFRTHPDLPEGQLAKLRASVVNMHALAGVARGLGPGGLGEYLRLGRGEELTGGRNKSSILADTTEALIGAVYLQHGMDVARDMVHRLFDPLLVMAPLLGAGLDWKTSLQELTASRDLGVPEYRITEDGPDHLKEFTATAVIAGVDRGSGQGRTKKEAEQRAAEAAWRSLSELASGSARQRGSHVPELPEVEVVRFGLEEHVTGRTVVAVEVRHPRSIRRHLAGELDFTARLCGRQIQAARRRGKYLWLDLGQAEAVLAHLGMSGQMRIQPPGAPDETHLRVRLQFADAGPELRFIDQRTFGGLSVEELVGGLPTPVAHIARDPMDPLFDRDAVVVGIRRRRTGLKRALLDQTLVSGIGNIYADEALWRARLHGSRPTATLTPSQGRTLLAAVTEVLTEALAAGGTSFDALYVNINGASGYFDRSLAVYGQGGRPCPRCDTAIRRESFMNRSSYSCPRCQPRPRHPHP